MHICILQLFLLQTALASAATPENPWFQQQNSPFRHIQYAQEATETIAIIASVTAATKRDLQAVSNATSQYSQNHQDASNAASTSRGTTLNADNLKITATTGDISASGAKLQASDITLDAQQNLNLGATSNTATTQSSGGGFSFGGGVTFGAGQQNGISFQGNASQHRNTANGDETIYDNTQVTATHKLNLQSGADTHLQGAQLAGNTVTAQVGGNLTIETLQDQSNYQSESSSEGFSVSVCVPPLCYGTMVTGSVNIASTSIDHSYQSAVGQSGIAAGAGGYDIQVKGNTSLTGAAITSTAPADQNTLTTASLTTSDLTNNQNTSASSTSISLAYSGASTGATMAANASSNLLGNLGAGAGLPSNGHQTSGTQSVITGKVTITGTGNAQVDAQSQQNANTLTTRDPASANAALSNTLTLQQGSEIERKQTTARQNAQTAGLVGSVLDGVIGDISQGNPDLAEGSAGKTFLHGFSGFIQARIGGTSALSGIASGAASEQFNKQFSDYLIEHGVQEGSADYQTYMAAGSRMLGAAVGAITSGGSNVAVNAAAGGNISASATVNNYLSHTEQMTRDKAKSDCYTKGDVQACLTAANLNNLDAARNQQVADLANKCGDNCWQVVNAINKELTALGCMGPQVCDDSVLNQAWRTAMEKAQALPQGSLGPDDAALLAFGLVRGGVRLVAGIGGSGKVTIVEGLGTNGGVGAAGEIATSTKPLALPAPQAGEVVPNAMSAAETAQASDIVAFKGGKFVGQPTFNTPGIDGWLDGVPVSLKEVTGNGMTAVQRNITGGATQMSKAGQVGDMYVDATQAGVSIQDVTNWVKPGTPISNILNEGTVNNITIKTTNGWVTLTRSTLKTPGTP